MDVSSSAGVVESVLRSWSSVQVEKDLQSDLIGPLEQTFKIESRKNESKYSDNVPFK
jgi:hypothetical protein